MTELKEGNVVVIRNGDYVEAIYYREFYEDVSDLADEVINYLNDKRFAEPNFSFMQVVGERLSPCDKNGEFYNEFPFFARIFNCPVAVCESCQGLNFVYPDSTKTYCHSCKNSHN